MFPQCENARDRILCRAGLFVGRLRLRERLEPGREREPLSRNFGAKRSSLVVKKLN